MQVLKGILIVLDIIVALAIIILVMMQHKEDQGASGTIVGGNSNNFFDKNKGKTKEGRLKKWTIILGIVFAIVAIALNIVYPL